VGEWAAAALLVVGAGFLLLAAVGIVRMPDLYSRMQAATKAATLGIACVMLGAAVHFGGAVVIRAATVVAFVFLTTPVGAHVIGRAAYMLGVPLWEGKVVDERRERRPPGGP
jgi:multicomponent Na+:H+ antiporter subunit G